jgi:hypothetical protein
MDITWLARLLKVHGIAVAPLGALRQAGSLAAPGAGV